MPEEKPRYSPTRVGYQAWLDDGNYGSYQEFLELWRERGIRGIGELITEILELIRQLNRRELEELLEYINDTYISSI